MVGVEILEGSKRAVRDTCRYSSFLVKFHGEHLPEVPRGSSALEVNFRSKILHRPA